MKEEQKNRKLLFRKIIKWLLITGLATALMLVLAAFIIVRFYQDEIKAVLVREINKNLRSEIRIDKISISLLERFPYATIRLSGVNAADATGQTRKGNLLKAGKLLLNFNIIDIYRKKYNIRRIELRDAAISIRIFPDGTDNYHFWKPISPGQESSIRFRLQKVAFRNVEVSYSDPGMQQHYQVLARNLNWSGDFTDALYTLKSEGKIFIRQISSDRITYLSDKDARMEMLLDVDSDKGSYVFRKGMLSFGGLDFSVNGKIIHNEREKTARLRVVSEKADLQQLIDELPEYLKKHLADYRAEGEVSFDASIAGSYAGKDYPQVRMTFSISGGMIRQQDEGIALEELFAEGYYSSREGNWKNVLHLSKFSSVLEGGHISGTFRMEGLPEPVLSFRAEVSAALSDLQRLLGFKEAEQLEGNLDATIDFRGDACDWTRVSREQLLQARCSGRLGIRDGACLLVSTGHRLEKVSANLEFNNNDVSIRQLSGTAAGSDFDISGEFRNMLPFLFVRGQQLVMDAALHSEKMDLETLLASGSRRSDTVFRLLLPANLDARLDCSFGNLQFGSFRASHLKGRVNLSGQGFYVGGFSCNAFSGIIKGSGNLQPVNDKQYQVISQLYLAGVDVRQLFAGCGNFGQDYLIDKNIRGICDGDIQLSFLMDHALNISLPTLAVNAGLTISEGQLLNYQPIQGLGKFIRVEDLSTVNFATLSNEILIRNKQVIIPRMDVVSDALNFTLSGVHGFDNTINYNISVLLSDLLWKKARKAKKENEEFGVEEKEQKGRTTLYILLTGTTDNPVFRYDSKSVRGRIVSKYLNEKENLKDLFREEFRRSKTKDSIMRQEYDDLQKQEEGKFLIEFDGSRTDSLGKQGKKDRKNKQKKTNTENSRFRVDWE